MALIDVLGSVMDKGVVEWCKWRGGGGNSIAEVVWGRKGVRGGFWLWGFDRSQRLEWTGFICVVGWELVGPKVKQKGGLMDWFWFIFG